MPGIRALEVTAGFRSKTLAVSRVTDDSRDFKSAQHPSHLASVLTYGMQARSDWLDAQQIQPILFEFDGRRFRLEFPTARPAAAFARAF